MADPKFANHILLSGPRNLLKSNIYTLSELRTENQKGRFRMSSNRWKKR